MSNLTQNSVEIARIEEQIIALNNTLTAHTEQDNINFEKLTLKIDALDSKIDSILIREAHLDGQRVTIKKMSGIISVVVSTVMTVISTLALKAFGL